MNRGRLIVLEGAEGAGKTTQVRRLADLLELNGISSLAVREPGGTPVGDAIRDILLDPASRIHPNTEALLFISSRAELIAREILPSLESGRTVLMDRFFLSTYAYQVMGRGLAEADVRAANRIATQGLVPDITILLDIPPGEGLGRADKRGARDRMEQTGEDFHARVGDAFRLFSRESWQHSHPECGPIKLIEGRGDEAEVFSRIVATLATAFPDQFSTLTTSAK